MPTKSRHECIQRLADVGFTLDDAFALRRISMTLHRWHELECGDGNSYGSWAIKRDDNGDGDGDGDGPPFMVRCHYLHGRGKDYTTRTPIPDRERGALERLADIMARYPGFRSYVQGDPRGCALYILRPGDVPEGSSIDSCYNRGIAVYK